MKAAARFRAQAPFGLSHDWLGGATARQLPVRGVARLQREQDGYYPRLPCLDSAHRLTSTAASAL